MKSKRAVRDREDLLREGVNLRVRGRVCRRRPESTDHEWVVGWRDSGAGSLFVDADPVFQFNQLGEFRRLYLSGQKWSVQNRRWGRLLRTARQDDKVQLQFVPAEQDVAAMIGHCWSEARRELLELLSLVDGKDAVVVESVGMEPGPFCSRLATWLDQIGAAPRLAVQPAESAET